MWYIARRPCSGCVLFCCQVVAGDGDRKFAELGRLMVTAVLTSRPPSFGPALENGVGAEAACDAAVLAVAPPVPGVQSRVHGTGASATAAEQGSDGSGAGAGGLPLPDSAKIVRHCRSERARFVTVPDAGHAVHIERPEAATRLLIEWLARST
jgi:hypothetical protein